MSAQEAAGAVQQALVLLGRASEDWRCNGACEAGSLHWPVAVNLARRELKRALEALEPQQKPQERHGDALVGMAVYNGWTEQQRAYWHARAESAVPADAWGAFKMGESRPCL